MTRALILLAALTSTAHADQEGEMTLRGGMMEVGRWAPMELGVDGRYGLRFGALALEADVELGGLFAATWIHGSIRTGPDAYVSGSLMRLGATARYSLARSIGVPDKRGERMDHHLFVEASVGEERVSADGMGAFDRPDYGIGVGYLMWGQLGDKHLAGVYGLHLRIAPALNTPNLVPMTLGETGARDIGVSFDFGLLFGG
jgi:hypothetical protein